jgi:hypothetical protein
LYSGRNLEHIKVRECPPSSMQNLSFSGLLSKNINIKICRIIILPAVLYGCDTWVLTLREEHRLRVFENRVLRRIFRPQKNKV